MSKKKRKPSQPPRPERESMETLDEQSVSGGAPVKTASDSGSADDPPTWEEGDSGQTFEADSDLPSDVIRTMQAAWLGAIEPGTPAGVTVKGNTVDDWRPRESNETWTEPGTADLSDAQLATIQSEPALKEQGRGPSPAKASAPPTAAPAKQKPAAADDAGDSADKTFLSDEFAPAAPAGRDTASESTLPDIAARQRETDDERTMVLKSDEGSIEKTFLSDEFAPLSPEEQARRAEGQRTDAGSVPDAGMQDAAAESEDSFEATLISDSHSGPEQAETMESGTRGVEARKTSPERIDEPFVEDQTDLVIKVRAFRQQDGTGPQDAEYQINRVLGEGGMGIVYDAIQTSVNRAVAVKMMKKPKAGKKLDQFAASRQKFLAEAVVTGDLDHPNIVPIYDVGRDDHNALFYSMKNVVGTPWLDVIRSRSVHENLEILMRVADAVAFAHARGVVHRDLKPENVMLGEFGEILVMDWGLAFPTAKFRKGDSLRRTTSMGGTPAYMAPEMATGPIDKIGAWSDIYLLGAILYEIVTGKPPHRGKNAMKCLMSAAKNQIEPSDKTGELMDIALKAMATDARDRHKTVQDFQSAVREYLSHTESVTLSSRAEDDLQRARQSGDYEDFQQAVFGFKEAFELWNGNKRAVTGLAGARLAYAECALRREDFDLGIDQLELSDPQHAALHGKLVAAKAERNARVQRIKTMKRVGLAAGLLFLVTAGSLTVWAMSERSRALVAEKDALNQQGIAESEAERANGEAQRALLAEADAKREAQRALLAEADAKREANRALVAEREARTNLDLATENEAKAKANLEKALEQEALAKRNEGRALIAQADAENRRLEAEANFRLAQQERQRAEYEAYIAQIGLAGAKIDENAFDSAGAILKLLQESNPKLLNWEWGRLMHLCSQQDATYDTNTRVESIAVSPDGTRLAVAGWDGAIEIRDLATGDALFTVEHEPGKRVLSVAFSSNGQRLATAGEDETAKLWTIDWQAGTANLAKTFAGHAAAVTSVALSHDGERLLTGSEDATARVWDTNSGQTLQRLVGHYDIVWAAAFAPRQDEAGRSLPETQIVTASQDGTAVVWTYQTHDDEGNSRATAPWSDPSLVRQSTPFRGHERGPVFAAAFSPDGSRVATGGFDRRVLIWNPNDLGKDEFQNVKQDDGDRFPVRAPIKLLAELTGHTNQVRSLSFSRDGKNLVTGSHDNTVKVWDSRTGKAIKTFRGHNSLVRACGFSPDAQFVYSGSYDNQVKKWGVESYQEVVSVADLQGRAYEGHTDAVLGATFSPNGDYIVTASQDRTAKEWDFRQSQEARRTYVEGHEYLASNAVFARKRGKLLTAAVDNTVRLWDVLTGTEDVVLKGTGRAAAVAVSPNEQWILTGSERNTAQLWQWTLTDDLRDRVELVGELAGHNKDVSAVAFSPDGTLLFTGDSAGNCRLWQFDATSRKATELHVLRGHSGRIVDVAFVDHGSRALLLTASADRTVGIWDVRSGAEDSRLSHTDGIVALAASPDGNTVLTSTQDRSLLVWSLRNPQRPVQQLAAPGGQAALAANVRDSLRGSRTSADLAARCNLSADEIDRFLAAASIGTVRYSTAELDKYLGEFTQATGKTRAELLRPLINSIDISPDGKLAVTANSEDRRVQIWNLATGQRMDTSAGSGALVWAALFAPEPRQVDGRTLYDILTVGGKRAQLWDIVDNREQMTFASNEEVASAAFSPDGKYIVTASWDNSARIWEAATGKSLLKLKAHAAEVRSATFSRDGMHVLTAGADGSVALWEVDWHRLAEQRGMGEQEPDVARVKWEFHIADADGKIAPAWQAVYSPDGTQIVASFDDAAARILDATTGNVLSELKSRPGVEGHARPVLCAAFSSNGQRVVTGSEDEQAIVWDVSDLKRPLPVLRLEGHTAAVMSVAFSPDPGSSRALTGSRDTTVKLWDADLRRDQVAADEPVEAPRPTDVVADRRGRRAQEILTLTRHDREVTSVQFSPDGRFVLTGSKDGTAVVWLTVAWSGQEQDKQLAAGAWKVRSSTLSESTAATGQE